MVSNIMGNAQMFKDKSESDFQLETEIVCKTNREDKILIKMSKNPLKYQESCS